MLPVLAARSAQLVPLVFGAAHQQTTPVPLTSAAAALQGHEGDILRIRAEQAAINDPLLSNAGQLLADQVRGGCLPRATDSAEANVAVNEWAASCAYRHQFGSLEQQVALVLATCIDDGEAYVRRVFAPVDDALAPNGLTLHVLRRRDIAIGHPNTEGGHEYDSTGSRVVATWFRDTSETGRAVPMRAVKVEHRDLAVLRLRRNADQIAGSPLYTASFVDAVMAMRLQKAQMRATELMAALSLVARTDNTSISTSWLTGGKVKPDLKTADGRPINEMRSGDAIIAHNIAGIHFPPLPDLGGIQAGADARIAAGAGTTKPAISGDTDGSSFAALVWTGIMMKMAADRFDRNAGYQRAMDMILRWYIEAELLAGRDWSRVTWSWPPRTTPDVMRTNAVSAVVQQLENNIISMPTARATLGLDSDKEADLIAAQPTTPQPETDATRHLTSV